MSAELKDKGTALFERHFGEAPHGVVFAPGRVNLIGEHVDYNDGLVLPMPVAFGTAIAWAPSGDDTIEVRAADFDLSDAFAASAPRRPATVDWSSYVRGMVAQMPGQVPGMRMLVTGDLPRGAGLSSSASLCIAVGRAVDEATGSRTDATTLARRAQATEHEYAEVACGMMDQMAVAAGRAGEAMLLDCRDLAFEHRIIPEAWAVIVADSGVTRGLVDGEYNARRAQCEAAAAKLGVASLRDADFAALDAARLPALEEKRARHVIGEIARVRDAAAALASKDLKSFGAILAEGHASLSDLFEVSVTAVDGLVERLQGLIGNEGGARLTGAGFGGSVVAVMPAERADMILEALGPSAFRAF